jgi:ribosomal protein L16/L10AE
MFEVAGIPEADAIVALKLAAAKLPVVTKVIKHN